MDLCEALTCSVLRNLIAEGHMDALLSDFSEGGGIARHVAAFGHRLAKLLPDGGPDPRRDRARALRDSVVHSPFCTGPRPAVHPRALARPVRAL
jgi:hypothetical protein